MIVWHIPQVPGEPFTVEVRDTTEAATVLNALAQYDLELERRGIRDDYSNAQGLWLDGNREEWEDENGYDICECIREDRPFTPTQEQDG